MLHLFITIHLLSCIYYALGNLYKLEPRRNIWHDDILEEFNINSKIHCASICSQKNSCIGFGITSERCFLLKSLGNEDICEESCLDLPEIKLYVESNFKITTTMTQIPSTTESSITFTTKSTTAATSESLTTATDSHAATKDSPATSRDSPATTKDSSATTTTEPRAVQTESSTKITAESSSTTTELPQKPTSQSPTTTTDLPTTATELPTTTAELPTTTTELPSTTTIAPLPPPEACTCGSDNSYLNGIRSYTKFYQDGDYNFDCQCMANEKLYKGNQGHPTENPVNPGKMTRCLRRKETGVVGLEIKFSGTKVLRYRITCDVFYDGFVDKSTGIIVKSSAPENKEVRCDDFQVIFGYQAIEQEDGSYEVRLECQPLIPRYR